MIHRGVGGHRLAEAGPRWLCGAVAPGREALPDAFLHLLGVALLHDLPALGVSGPPHRRGAFLGVPGLPV
jgi:hypothetical protein